MTDVNQLITDHLDIWTSATEKKSSAGRGNGGAINLYGIKKLRALILDLAVRGKLVPQDDTDETSASYLNEITRMRDELVQHGKAKKLKSLPDVSEDEIAYDLPTNWTWLRLQNIAKYIQRGKSPKYADEGSVQVVSQKCVQWGSFVLEKARHISNESLDGYVTERFLTSGDILWNSTGTGTVGRVLAINVDDDEPLVADSHVTVIRTISGCPRFLEIFLSSAGIQDRIDPGHERSLVSGSTKQVELNTSTVIALPVPLPPLAEQHRIVAKVDQLMELCDALEAQAEDSLKAHQTLVETCLATLTNSQTPEDLTQNWTRLDTHFETLFTTEESIAALRRAMLDLALHGLLTEQSKDDEPAPILLSELYKSNKKSASSRHRTIVSNIKESQNQFDLPESWAWSNLGLLSSELRYGTSKKCDRDNSLVPVLRIPNVSGGKVDLNDMKFGPLDQKEVADLGLRANDILIIRSNGSLNIVGSFAVVPELEGDFAFAGYLVRVRIDPAYVDPQYVWYVSRSRFLRDQIEGPIRHGVGLKNVNSTELASLTFPIPPKDEQERIVCKLDGLFELCDQLSKKIIYINSVNIALADTLTSKIH